MALVVSAICWYFGADVWRSILFGIAITSIFVAASVAVALGMAPDVRATTWPGGRRASLRGSRHDVVHLSSSLSASWGVGHMAESRVRQLVRQRLALHHLDLGSPADRLEIEQLIGRRAYRLLARGQRRRMRLRSFLHCLDVVDGLDPIHDRRPTAGIDTALNSSSPPRRTPKR